MKYDILQLNDMLVPELKDLAKEKGIKTLNKLNKQELIYKILDEQAVSENDDSPSNSSKNSSQNNSEMLNNEEEKTKKRPRKKVSIEDKSVPPPIFQESEIEREVKESEIENDQEVESSDKIDIREEVKETVDVAEQKTPL